MDDKRTSRSMKRLGLVLVACFIGMPLAVAPVMGQGAFRPLTIGHSLKVAQAYGVNDEDCVFVTRRVSRPDGTSHPNRTLVCND